MLSKEERLKRVDFNRFFSSGRRFHHAYFTLIYAPYPSPHIAVVVSKKIANRATARNKIRRKMYDILRHHIRSADHAGICILIVKKEALTASHSALREALISMFGKAERNY